MIVLSLQATLAISITFTSQGIYNPTLTFASVNTEANLLY